MSGGAEGGRGGAGGGGRRRGTKKTQTKPRQPTIKMFLKINKMARGDDRSGTLKITKAGFLAEDDRSTQAIFWFLTLELN